MDARPLYYKTRYGWSIREDIIIAMLVVTIPLVFLVGALLEGPGVADTGSEPEVISAQQATDDD